MPVSAIPSIRVSQRQPVLGSRYLGDLKDELSIDFDTYDKRLKACLEAAGAEIERQTGILLTPCMVTVAWSEFYDFETLPRGPVAPDSVTITDLGGNLIDTLVSDDQFAELTGNYPSGIKLTYKGGYDELTIPGDLKQAIIDLAANLFDKGNRDWKSAIRSHRRTTWAS